MLPMRCGIRVRRLFAPQARLRLYRETLVNHDCPFRLDWHSKDDSSQLSAERSFSWPSHVQSKTALRLEMSRAKPLVNCAVRSCPGEEEVEQRVGSEITPFRDCLIRDCMARVENTRRMSEELLSVETSTSSASPVACAVEKRS